MIYIISAYRTDRSASENRRRTATLDSRLAILGVPAIPADGEYRGAHEDSRLVFGVTQATILELATTFHQESVLEIDTRTLEARLVYTGSAAGNAEPLGRWTQVNPSGSGDCTIVAGARFQCVPVG